MFSYHFNSRSQWIFDSPNHFATVLGMSLILVGGFQAWLLQQHHFGIRRLLALSCATAFLGVLSLSLVRTYSRGGWIAFIAGVCVFLCSLHKWRRVPILLISIFLTLLLLVPDAADRSNPNAFGTDRSVGNRILVWKGALAMTVAHWASGVGDGRFGDEFTSWFQPVQMKTRYRTAINNYLTLSAERGIIALWAYLALLSWPLLKAWKIATTRQHVLMLGILAAQVVYLVSGIFTYTLTIWEVAGPFWFLFALTAAYCLKPQQSEPVKLGNAFRPAVFTSTAICMLLLAVGHRLQAASATQSESFNFTTTVGKEAGVIVRPTHIPASGVILWVHGQGGSIHEDGRDTLRYLAEKGFVVISVNYRNNGMDGLQDIRALSKWVLRQSEFEKLPFFLAGSSLGARLSILVACDDPSPRLKAVASLAAAAEWPFPELSPVEHLYDLQAPLLIIHGSQDKVNFVEQAYVLEKFCKRYRKKYELMIVDGASHHFDANDQWFRALDRVAGFFKSSAAVPKEVH